MNNFSDQFLSKSFQQKLKNNVEKEYRFFIEDVREDLNKGFNTDIVDAQFLDQLNDIIHDEAFDTYSPLKFYWMNLLDNLIYIVQLHEEILNAEEYNEDNDNLSESEEELNLLWQDSELSKIFEELLENGTPVLEASDQLLPLLENQIISFYVLHINQYQQEFDDAIVYQSIAEIGDFEKRTYIGDGNKYIEFKTPMHSFPTLPIKKYVPQEDLINLDEEDKDIPFNILNLNSDLKIDVDLFTLIPACEYSIKHINEIKKHIQSTLEIIKYSHQNFFNTLSSFTKKFVLIGEEEFKSGSMQSLPEFTSINFKLSNIELIIRLALETSNHYLNTLLNQEELWNDNEGFEYFSPWKRGDREISNFARSAFQAAFIFEVLFSIEKAAFLKKINLDKKELNIVRQKLIEEYKFLSSINSTIDEALKEKSLTKKGHEVIKSLIKKVVLNEKAYNKIESNFVNESDENKEFVDFIIKNLHKN